MKKFSLLALAAAGLLLGACSEKNEVVSDSNGTNPYGLIEGESSWIAVGIAMPGDPITRANEDLTDGDEDEYKIYSGTLYLFKGANEDDAIFFGSYPINTTFDNEGGDNVPPGNTLDPKTGGNSDPTKYGEITSTSQKIVQEIENPSLGVNEKLYAYVILNDANNATTIGASEGSTTGAQFKKLQLKAIGIIDESAGFGKIKNTNNGASANAGLVMTNVPIATAPGGDTDPTGADVPTFTEINKDAIYKTAAEANAAGAQMACIYVERAAVKVEVTLDPNFGIQLDGESSPTAILPANVKWALGNVNFAGTKGTGSNAITGVGYYNTRQFDTDWLPYNNPLATQPYLKYRMVGRTKFFDSGHTPAAAYRTYFGKDPNYTGTGTIPYDANKGLLNAQLSDASGSSQYTLNPGDITYTYENTFDENSQIYRNTTYVGVRVNINNSSDFYTIQGQPNMKLNNTTDIKSVVSNRLRDAINTKIANIKAAIDADLGKTSTSGRTISDGVTKVTFDYDITITLDPDDPSKTGHEGYNAQTGEQTYTVTGSLTNIKTDGTAASAADQSAIATLASTNVGTIDTPANSKVYKYVGGIAYYSARIQHFGDVETPWGAPAEAYNVYQHATNPCVYPANGQQTYGGSAHNFGINHGHAWLGRWGIVRNNWYSLKLKKIEGIGSPVPEDFNGDAGNTPDDNPGLSYFIAAEVHILPWVKRMQEVTF